MRSQTDNLPEVADRRPQTGARPTLAALLLALLLAALPLPARAATITLDDYWQQIEALQTLVEQLEDVPPATSRPQLQTAADQLAAITTITLPNGTQLAVDHSYLVGRLRAPDPDYRQLAEMLAALRQARDTWPHPELNYAYSPLWDILARPEFQWQEQPRSPLAELWDRIIIWLLERVADLFEITGMTGAATAGLFRFVFTAVFILITAAALAYLFQGLLANFVAEAEIDADDDGFIENLTAKIALERAQTLSSSGDYRSAVRYLYLSTLLMLEERGLLRYDRSLTNREYLRSIAHLPELFAILYEVIDVFDRVWYGYQPLNEAEYTHYATRVAELKRQK